MDEKLVSQTGWVQRSLLLIYSVPSPYQFVIIGDYHSFTLGNGYLTAQTIHW